MNKNKQKEILKDRFGRVVGMTTKALKNYLDKKLIANGYDINFEEVIIIVNLWFENGLNQQQITEIICRDKTSTTRFIDDLEARNLVKRINDVNDRRQNIVKLTKKGEKKCAALIRFMEDLQEEILKGIDPDHIEICKDVLKQVQRNLSEGF
ncbi:MAG: MarR family transcriptional regulator [candidate division Zixibacteria bacterium]|nr:MarR family transcriptional regulator [candidate division Zixibacteria bacterium]